MADSHHTIGRASNGEISPPSRRALIKGASSAVAVAGLASSAALANSPDETISLCRRWTALEMECEAIWSEWADIEARLSKQHDNFFKLSDLEQRMLPDGGARMLEIEQTSVQLAALREDVFPKIPRLRARTTEAVVAKLVVAGFLVVHDEHPEAHKIIKDSIKDLRRLHQLKA